MGLQFWRPLAMAKFNWALDIGGRGTTTGLPLDFLDLRKSEAWYCRTLKFLLFLLILLPLLLLLCLFDLLAFLPPFLDLLPSFLAFLLLLVLVSTNLFSSSSSSSSNAYNAGSNTPRLLSSAKENGTKLDLDKKTMQKKMYKPIYHFFLLHKRIQQF